MGERLTLRGTCCCVFGLVICKSENGRVDIVCVAGVEIIARNLKTARRGAAELRAPIESSSRRGYRRDLRIEFV
jgi:hypothetical protein